MDIIRMHLSFLKEQDQLLAKGEIPFLRKGIITVLHLSLPSKLNIPSSFWPCLSEEEKQKSNSLYFIKDQEKYVFCRGLLRHLLAFYTNTLPRDILLLTNDYGKPYIASYSLHFNLSHTSDYIAFAFSLDTPLGIDVEKVEPFTSCLSIAKTMFSKEEYLYLNCLSELEQTTEFFRLWTKKEALIKAKGLGLGEENALNSWEDLKLRKENSFPTPSHIAWSLHELMLSPYHLGTLAYLGERQKVQCYQIEKSS